MVRRALAGVLALFVFPIAFGAAFEDALPPAAPTLESAQAFQPSEETAAYSATQTRVGAEQELRNGLTPASGSAGPAEGRRPQSEPPEACPPDMVAVEGQYCGDVRHDCKRWLDDEKLPFARCAEYAPPARCVGKQRPMRYCIDRYEFTPPGDALPLAHASFVVASKICKAQGKRVCTEDEWNFACEGEEMRPYPYGWSREPSCNQDRDDLYVQTPTKRLLKDHREPADGRPDCVSPFGVYNMAGNMDEPVLREVARFNPPFRNALKGGWWMAARNRCRPATTAHDDYYEDIQIGVRCCADQPSAPNSPAG